MNTDANMEFEHVVKRNGEKERMSIDKIEKRIASLCDGLSVNLSKVTRDVASQLYDNMKTVELDELSAQICASLCTEHIDYGKLASRIIISNHHKNTSPSFSEVIRNLYENKNIHDKHSPLISKELYDIVQNNKEKLNSYINYERDYEFDYFGFKTLEKSYLMRIKDYSMGQTKEEKVNLKGKIVERPQHLLMRVSLGIHGSDIKRALNTYDLMSTKYFIHATPTLFNAGTPRPQLSSCFLLAMKEDSIDGIYSTLRDCAMISKWAGGIGLHIHNVRAKNSIINGTNGISNGIVPMLRVFNNTARYVDQGGGKRNGSIAIYLEPWHADIQDFLLLRKNHGNEEERARDLFYAMWVSDLFMKRVKENKDWSLFCPNECPGLPDTYGDEFEALYTKYEQEGRAKKVVRAQELWFQILESQIETGTPYICYKDASNKKSNQKNLGTIKSSNLCVAPETLILTDKGHLEIQNLKDKSVNVWNGKEFSEVTVKQTSDSSQLITVNLSDGSELTCTKYHKFYIQDKYTPFNMKKDIVKSKPVSIVEAKDLKPDMKLIKCDYPIIDGNENLESSYTNGFFSGDGTYSTSKHESKPCNYKSQDGYAYCKRHIKYQKDSETSEQCNAISNEKKPIVSLYGEKIKLLPYLDYRSYGEEKNNKLNVCLSLNLEDKFFVPMNYSLTSKLNWFSGYVDADGSICKNGKNQSLQVSSINKEFLMKVKLMLQTCGISSKVMKNMGERVVNLPDGNGGKKNYNCKKLWRLLVSSNELQKLVELGFEPKRLVINQERVQRSATQFVKVSNIVDNQRTDKTFCFTETKRHAGIFNGVITSQCTEIIEYSDSDEFAVCNLASIGLPNYVVGREDGTTEFDFDKLLEVSKIVTRNLDKVIDVNFYPVPETKRSNMRHRPIGIGVQGLADVFAKMRLPFDSPEAKVLNERIFETIYFGALSESNQLAVENKPYETYEGSPMSKGIFQFEMWETQPTKLHYEWETLRDKIKEKGIRNSLLVAPMPTASTSQILGNNECFEPFTSNIYLRRTLAGEFVVVNKHLIQDCIQRNIWSTQVKNKIIANNGSIQNIPEIPDELKPIYKTSWELSNKTLIDLAADRGKFICQSQSLNLFMESPNFNSLSAMHFYSWKKGLKTGIYYLRTRPVTKAQQFTIEPENKPTSPTLSSQDEEKKAVAMVCDRSNPDCEACSA